MGGMDPEIPNAAKYDGALLVYLVAQDAKCGEDNYNVTNSEKGVMKEVDQLYDLAVSAGLIIFEEDKSSKEIIKRRPLLQGGERSGVDPVNAESASNFPSAP